MSKEIKLPTRSEQYTECGCVCVDGFTSSGIASCMMKLCVLARTDQFHPHLTTRRNDVLWEQNRKRLSSDEDLLMSYKNPTQPGPTVGRNNRHNEE